MSALKKLQQKFIQDCLSGDTFSSGAALNEARISAAGQMGIYRESAIGNITSAMRLTYPRVENLVGAAFFGQTCRQYIHQHWPGSGDMNDYGAGFADFLTGYELAKALPYLPDMARLDWLFHESSLADDAQSADWRKLSALSPEELSALKIKLHPSVRLLSSAHPVLKIWDMCQEGTENSQQIDLSKESGAHVLLVRKALKVDLYPLSPGEMTFLRVLQAGGALFEAFEAAMAAEEGAAVQTYLLKHIEIASFLSFFQ